VPPSGYVKKIESNQLFGTVRPKWPGQDLSINIAKCDTIETMMSQFAMMQGFHGVILRIPGWFRQSNRLGRHRFGRSSSTQPLIREPRLFSTKTLTATLDSLFSQLFVRFVTGDPRSHPIVEIAANG
jgi:hypothetical protein